MLAFSAFSSRLVAFYVSPSISLPHVLNLLPSNPARDFLFRECRQVFFHDHHYSLLQDTSLAHHSIARQFLAFLFIALAGEYRPHQLLLNVKPVTLLSATESCMCIYTSLCLFCPRL